ncbi:MAG TPA: iron-containing alcohol dehydrogenase [Bacillota bacterium]|nr:iron-containing alcohol dehydrogenase [Bacillota bacterium]HPF41984.1 iron-containing alcohol dehydrogenase [Bacillota bacterium]HPJ85942.1 iron-containing alcohol dehydrogenase [Bacillota bacterium]HPQ61836.1 iron-containing alcohol dehydrogenase [Bacillota bacterium]HRX91187.1 iron-containing alcohol dehydrogenase [Candidatus Izemoplasmatales bacterium]
MENFRFYSPTEIVFGKQSENEVGELLKQQGATNVFIHYGGGSVVRSGLLDRVIATLDENKIQHFELGGARPNPRSGLVYEGIKLCKQNKADFVLAVGSGSAIDSAKAIAAGSKYDGDFWDFYEGKARIKDALPVGVILTLPAAGSEASQSAVITQEKGMLKKGITSRFYRPRFAIVDPELTYTAPMYQMACGVVDMMGHIMERYFTNSSGTDLTDAMSEAVLRQIILAADNMIKDNKDYEARATLCFAGTIAHNGILGVGKKEDWTTHFLEHELSALYDVAHGAGLAVMYPAYMKYVMDTNIERFRKLAINVFEIKETNDSKSVALQGIEALKAFYRKIGMPTNFQELGVKKEDIPLLLATLEKNRGQKFGNFQELTLDDAKNIYLLACES